MMFHAIYLIKKQEKMKENITRHGGYWVWSLEIITIELIPMRPPLYVFFRRLKQ